MPSGVVFAPQGLTLWTRLSVFLHNGSPYGGPVKRRQKKRLKMRGRSVVGVRSPPPLLDTVCGKGRVSPTWMSYKGKNFGGVSPPFHLVAVFTSCLHFSWNSVISLILKFKNIDFYLVYRYLLNFSVGEFCCVSVSEGV